MDVYVCDSCGYYYDPECGDEENGVLEGTAFSSLPKPHLISAVFRTTSLVLMVV